MSDSIITVILILFAIFTPSVRISSLVHQLNTMMPTSVNHVSYPRSLVAIEWVNLQCFLRIRSVCLIITKFFALAPRMVL